MYDHWAPGVCTGHTVRVNLHPDEVISAGYHDIAGSWHATSPQTHDRLAAAMGAPGWMPPMWFVVVGTAHPLLGPCEVRLDDGTSRGVLTHLPDDLPIGYHDLVPTDGGPTTRLVVHPSSCPPLPRAWGVAAQVYALWDHTSWGIGDLGNLRTLAERVAGRGGGVVLTSPLHQGAPGFPQHDSPYYPSTRRAWSPLLLAIDEPPPAELRADPARLIDRNVVWAAKRRVLWQRFGRARGTASTPPSPVALWNARRERFGHDAAAWPSEVDDRLLLAAHFHDWLQTLVAEQLAAVAATGIAVVGDLAVGFAPDGADAHEFASSLAEGVRIGAPPDAFTPAGQDWGLPAFVPWRLRAGWYEPFIATVRAALRGVQGLRIDHVMGLFRQYWVPAGARPVDGAYVRFPADELLAIICLEATRAGAFVVGEDLGTVEAGVRERLAAAGVASTRVVLFDDEPPAVWPEPCLATVTTHDLPTALGTLALPTDDPCRRRLLAATGGGEPPVAAVHRALLASPAAVRLMTADDLAGARLQANTPGTVGRPNWCRPLPLTVADIPLPSTARESPP